MKAKIKKGGEYLFTEGCSNDWRDLKGEMIINFMDKYSYKNFKQIKNHLFIELYDTNDIIDIVFTGDVPILEFELYDTGQLILKLK